MRKFYKSPKESEIYEPGRIQVSNLLTARKARDKYKPPYTLQAILDHVLRVCSYSQEIYGYEVSRMDQKTTEQLEVLGYRCESYYDNDKKELCLKISWKEEE